MAPLRENHRVENIALAVLAVVVALIAAYAVLTRPGSGTSSEVEFARSMPENYKPVLAALVRASGHECDNVCTASVAEPQFAPARVRLACVVAAKNITCDHAREFDITVKPAVAEPSR